jgi:hypothetical protein
MSTGVPQDVLNSPAYRLAPRATQTRRMGMWGFAANGQDAAAACKKEPAERPPRRDRSTASSFCALVDPQHCVKFVARATRDGL